MIVSGKAPPQFDELYAALLELKVRFRKPDSWYARAIARVLLGVRQVEERHWLVPGLPGDSYSLYNVWLTREGKYICDCYGRLYGYKRERGICTHVASVMLARRWKELKRALGCDSDKLPGDHSNAVPGQRHGHHD